MNCNETGTDHTHSSTDIPLVGDGNTSPCSKISQDKPNVPTDIESTNQNNINVVPNISANVQHTGQNNTEWDPAKAAVQNSTSHRQHRDKDSTLSSPQKHREKRKHCDSADPDKRKKRKHSRDVRFEGHRISHLVKKRTYKKAEDDDNATENGKKSDDYVLAKLFKKSGRLLVLNSHYKVYFFFCVNVVKGLFCLIFRRLLQVSTV